MDMIMRGSTSAIQGFQLGEGWAGPNDASYTPGSGPGGKKWDSSQVGVPTPPPDGPPRNEGDDPSKRVQGAPSLTGQAIAGMAPIPSAPGTAMPPPGFVNPFGSYSDRDKLVNPIVNPFRRNIGG